MSEKDKLLSIGAAAEKAGVSRQSLQYYLMVGLLEPTEVTPSGRRLFDEKAVRRIRLIKKLNDSGYPLRAIRELFLQGRTGTQTRNSAFGQPRSDLKGSES
ncbi:MAG: helix-turn-helix domain-containing protein [Planctomycetota bacterium]